MFPLNRFHKLKSKDRVRRFLHYAAIWLLGLVLAQCGDMAPSADKKKATSSLADNHQNNSQLDESEPQQDANNQQNINSQQNNNNQRRYKKLHLVFYHGLNGDKSQFNGMKTALKKALQLQDEGAITAPTRDNTLEEFSVQVEDFSSLSFDNGDAVKAALQEKDTLTVFVTHSLGGRTVLKGIDDLISQYSCQDRVAVISVGGALQECYLLNIDDLVQKEIARVAGPILDQFFPITEIVNSGIRTELTSDGTLDKNTLQQLNIPIVLISTSSVLGGGLRGIVDGLTSAASNLTKQPENPLMNFLGAVATTVADSLQKHVDLPPKSDVILSVRSQRAGVELGTHSGVTVEHIDGPSHWEQLDNKDVQVAVAKHIQLLFTQQK